MYIKQGHTVQSSEAIDKRDRQIDWQTKTGVIRDKRTRDRGKKLLKYTFFVYNESSIKFISNGIRK